MFNATPNDDGSSDPKWQELGADDQPPAFIEVIRKTDKRCKWGFRQLGPQQDGKRTWGPWRSKHGSFMGPQYSVSSKGGSSYMYRQ